MKRVSLAAVSTRSDDDLDDEQLHHDVSQNQAPRGGRAAGGVVAGLTGADVSTPVSVVQLPAPYDVEETVTAPLNDREREHLAVCEEALRGFRRSTIVAGKALEVISRGRLYRETHATFVEYLDDVWEIRKSQAYRMIEAWPVAAAVSPIGDINEGQARELIAASKTHDMPTAVALYQGVKELRGDRKVTAADIAEARAVLPPPRRLASPDQVGDVLRVAVAEGRAPRLAPPAPVQPAEQDKKAGAPEMSADDVGQDQVQEGAEAVATLEAALAQQRQIYDRLAGIIPAALLYDPARSNLLLREIRQYANRTAYRARDRSSDDSED
ncbi:hypothetical protein ABT330_33645 [Streptomyces sp. NPDC000658]|uniref:hypothetical protein n=1 Tax=Streptomyces sp. NPDC000658 TaxID=3154266 RepID=UPI0033255608